MPSWIHLLTEKFKPDPSRSKLAAGFIVPKDVFRKGIFLRLRAPIIVPGSRATIFTLVDRDADESSSRRAFGAMQLIHGVLLLCHEVTGAGMGQDNVTTHRTSSFFS